MKKLLKYGWRTGLKRYLLQLLQGNRKLVYRLLSENADFGERDRSFR
ncbi:hypothetical protein [Pseudomonas borbori]|nr:hypothetical protein [Pseudomonas borbori]